MRIVYADTLFVINAIINYLILLASAKICAVPASRLRMGGAAVLGGAYAVIAALPSAAFLLNPFAIIAAGVLIITTAFGGQPRLLRISLVFFAVSAAFAGAVLAAALLGGGSPGAIVPPISVKVLLIAFAASYGAISLVFRRVAGNKGGVVPITIKQGERTLNLRALIDTGNSLIDPMTGTPVIVAGVPEVLSLFTKEIRSVIEVLPQCGAATVLEMISDNGGNTRFRLIPYSAVGVSGGVLLTFKPDEIVINGKVKPGVLIALSPNSVSDNGTYTALIGA